MFGLGVGDAGGKAGGKKGKASGGAAAAAADTAVEDVGAMGLGVEMARMVPAVVLAVDTGMYEKWQRIGATQAESSIVRWQLADITEEIARLEEQVDDENKGEMVKAELKGVKAEEKRLLALQKETSAAVGQVYKECILEYGSDWLHRSSIEKGIRWLPMNSRREAARVAASVAASVGAGAGAGAGTDAAAAVADPSMLDLGELVRELSGHGVLPS